MVISAREARWIAERQAKLLHVYPLAELYRGRDYGGPPTWKRSAATSLIDHPLGEDSASKPPAQRCSAPPNKVMALRMPLHARLSLTVNRAAMPPRASQGSTSRSYGSPWNAPGSRGAIGAHRGRQTRSDQLASEALLALFKQRMTASSRTPGEWSSTEPGTPLAPIEAVAPAGASGRRRPRGPAPALVLGLRGGDLFVAGRAEPCR